MKGGRRTAALRAPRRAAHCRHIAHANRCCRAGLATRQTMRTCVVAAGGVVGLLVGRCVCGELVLRIINTNLFLRIIVICVTEVLAFRN